MQKNEQLEIYNGLKSGKSFIVRGSKKQIQEVIDECEHCKVEWLEDNSCRIIRGRQKVSVIKIRIEKMLDEYSYKDIVFDTSFPYVRSTISAYNTENGTHFKSRTDNGKMLVFMDVEHRPCIKQSEYDETKDRFQSILHDMKARVMPDNYFIYNGSFEPDYEEIEGGDLI